MDETTKKNMKFFPVGSNVKIKSRLEYSFEHHLLSLSAEKMDMISNVKIVID